jgi:hypothetical protein
VDTKPAPTPRGPASPASYLARDLALVADRRRINRGAVTPSTTPGAERRKIPPLPPDLDLALRRLKLAAVRRSAPKVLLTAKTQRWAPEELQRTLVEAEIAAPTPPTPPTGSRPPLR